MISGMSIVGWMRRNAGLFRHAGTALGYNRNIGHLLLIGPFAEALSPFFHKFAPQSEIYVYRDDLALEQEPSSEYDIQVSSLEEEKYDFIAAPLYIMYLPPASLASFLFDCHDALQEGGVLYLSFCDAIAPLTGMTDYKSWYSDERLKLKFYSLSDMLASLDAVGFFIKDIQIDSADVFDRIVTMVLVKNLE